jgi:AraC-like DNA-binding protein
MTEEQFLRQVQCEMTWANVRRWRAGEAVASPGSSGYALWLVRQGCVEAEMGEGRWRVGAGDALLSPPHIARDRIATPAGAEWLSVGINAQLFGRLDVMPLLAPPRQWRPDEKDLACLSQWMEQASEHWRDVPRPENHPLLITRRPHDPVAEMVSNGLALAIFGICWRTLRAGKDGQRIPLSTALPGAPEWFLDVLGRIQREPGVGAAELSRAFRISPAHLRRAFHRYLSQSPQQYLTERPGYRGHLRRGRF